jgi:hypothetical protein
VEEKYHAVRQATDDRQYGAWALLAVLAHAKYVILTAISGNNGYWKTPQYYVIMKRVRVAEVYTAKL